MAHSKSANIFCGPLSSPSNFWWPQPISSAPCSRYFMTGPLEVRIASSKPRNISSTMFDVEKYHEHDFSFIWIQNITFGNIMTKKYRTYLPVYACVECPPGALKGSSHPACLARVVSWFACVVAIFMAHENGDKQRPVNRGQVQGILDATEFVYLMVISECFVSHKTSCMQEKRACALALHVLS